MSKDILFRKEAMDKMLVGLGKAAQAVAGTIGPKGLNVYLDDPIQPKITNDGFTIAGNVRLKDKQEDAGAYVIRNITSQQNEDVGDGTTTVAVLTNAIIQECLKRPENPMTIKASLKEAGDEVLKMLQEKAVKLDKADIKKVALISSEDEQIAQLITEIIEKLGENAVVNVEDSKTFDTEYEIVDGYEAHVGFMSPHFITDKKANRAVYTDVPVLVSETKISSITDIAPIFEMFKNEGISNCIIVAEDIDDSILGILVQNKLMGTFNSLVIRAQAWLLQDIEGATGAKAISASTGVTFKNFTKDQLGFTKKIVCDANKTVFTTDGEISKQYAAWLSLQAEGEQNQFQAKKLEERAAKMRGGVAVLKIGASTDFERDYLRLKAEDSVKAVQAALEEGIVEGGGMTLWRIASEMTPKTIGEEILKKALTAPFKQILENAGKDYSEVVANMQLVEKSVNNEANDYGLIGYDAKSDLFVNMIKSGIIDPAKVERCAVENAVSSVSTFITTFATIIDIPDENN